MKTEEQILKLGDNLLTELKKNPNNICTQLNKNEEISFNTGFLRAFVLGYQEAAKGCSVLNNSIPSVVRKGFAQAMDGNELWVNTETDEMIKIVVKDKETLWKLYCKHVKITIEVIDETELD